MMGSLSSLAFMQLCRFKHKIRPEFKDLDAFLNCYTVLYQICDSYITQTSGQM